MHIKLQIAPIDVIVTGFALFSMFFGAGNLIFPPYLGLTSGEEWLVGFFCFFFVEVVLSCIGIFTMIYGGGSITALESVVGKVPGMILNATAIICTGILIATPRTAATTFEMSVAPFTHELSLFTFSLLFFAVVFIFSIRPTRFVDIIGKFLTPGLIVCIFILIIVGVNNPIGDMVPTISDNVVKDGVIAGYQTMDILSVSGFAIVILNTLRLKGYSERKVQLKAVVYSCSIAGMLLSLIYGGLAYLGATSGTVFDSSLNQAELIVAITSHLLGKTGMFILGIIVGLACLTTAIGLTGATAYFLEKISKGKVSYQKWVVFDIIICILICNLGLSTIIKIAVPILSILCPPFMTTVLLLLFKNKITNTLIYKTLAFIAFLLGLITTVWNYI